MSAPFTLIDATGQHIERVAVQHYEARGEVTVRTEHLSIYLPDPIGLWEQLTDALRGTEGDHLREYLGGAS